MRLVALGGDITRQDVDAIVNAANERLLGGSGVDGAIHRAAGPRLLEACRAIPEVAPGVRCPTGEARITPGFDLPARHVIHTVGPVYDRHPDPDGALRSAFVQSAKLAIDEGLRTVAFPAISCGVYGFPVDRAAGIAAEVFLDAPLALDEVRFVLFDGATLGVFQAAFGA